MTIRNRLTLIIIILMIMTGSIMASGQIFTFAPEVSKSFERHVYTVHTRSADNQQGLVDSTKAFYHNEFVTSPIGFDLVNVPDSIKTIRNGQAIDNPISTAMAKTTSRMVLDDAGHCLSIEGYDKLVDNLLVDDTSLYTTIKENLKPVAMAAKESGEWNALIDPLVGSKVNVGVMENLIESFQAGANNLVDLYTQVECVDTFWVDEVYCARVYFHSDSDFERLAKRRKLTVEELQTDFNFNELPPKSDQVDVLRVVQLVLEVETMKLLGVMHRTQITMTAINETGASYPISLTETKDARFFYEPIK